VSAPTNPLYARMVYRCDWVANRVMFCQRPLGDAKACPEGWQTSEELAREDVAHRLSRMAADLMRAADEVRRVRRGE
jgi:hypothetical protein